MVTGLIQHSEELWLPLEKVVVFFFFFLPHHRSSRVSWGRFLPESSQRGRKALGPRRLEVPASGKQGREGKDPWGRSPDERAVWLEL